MYCFVSVFHREFTRCARCASLPHLSGMRQKIDNRRKCKYSGKDAENRREQQMERETSFLQRTWSLLIYFDFKLRRKPIDNSLLWRLGELVDSKQGFILLNPFSLATHGCLPTIEADRMSSTTSALVVTYDSARARWLSSIDSEGWIWNPRHCLHFRIMCRQSELVD